MLWATGLTLLGYSLGGIELLQDNIEAALLLIVAFSMVPMAYRVVAAPQGARQQALSSSEES